MLNDYKRTGYMLRCALVLLCAGWWLPMHGVWAQDTPTTSVCKALDFRAIAYSINDTQAREKRALEWLSRYGKDCPFPEIEAIRNNVAVWLGLQTQRKYTKRSKNCTLAKSPWARH